MPMAGFILNWRRIFCVPKLVDKLGLASLRACACIISLLKILSPHVY